MRRVFRIGTLAFAASLVGAHSETARAAVTIINGDFANTSGLYTSSGPDFDTLFALNSTSITGWTVGGGGVDWVKSYWQAPPGATFSVDLSGRSPGSLSQTLTGLTAGEVYVVSFELSGNPDGGPNPKPLLVAAAGKSENYIFSVSGHSRANMGWEEETFTFTANGASDVLTFTSESGTPYGPVLGDVELAAAVAEPSTWAMMLLGFTSLSLASYRQARRPPPVRVLAR
jgi:choice-of-anchor C domain-containing protein